MRYVFFLLILMSLGASAEPAPQLRVTGLPDHEVYPTFNASGSHLTLESHDELRVWDLSNFRLLKHLRFRVNDLISHDLSPDGRYLAVSTRPRRLQVHDLVRGSVAFSFSGVKGAEREGAYGLTFSPDGSYLAAYGSGGAREMSDRNLRIWRTSDWQRVGLALSQDSSWSAWRQVVWTPWNQLAHVTSDQRSLELYDPVGASLRHRIPLTVEPVALETRAQTLALLTDTDLVSGVLHLSSASGDLVPGPEIEAPALEGQTLKPVTDKLWMRPAGYGGPTTFYSAPPVRTLGDVSWACPPEVSRDGRWVAWSSLKGVQILDIEKTLSEGTLVPYRP